MHDTTHPFCKSQRLLSPRADSRLDEMTSVIKSKMKVFGIWYGIMPVRLSYVFYKGPLLVHTSLNV